MKNKKHEVRYTIKNGYHNCLKCSKSPAEKGPHRLTKFYLAEWCWRNKIDFSTEAVFYDGARCDFIIHDWGLIIEVLNTEDLKDYKKKVYPYPSIPIIIQKTNKRINSMMEDLHSCNGSSCDYYIRLFKQGYDRTQYL